MKAFAAAYGAKFPKAEADWDEFAADIVGQELKVMKRINNQAAALAVAFKLIESAQRRWRMVNAPHLVALVRAGATFTGAKLVERPAEQASSDSRQAPAAARQEIARAA